MNIFTQFRAGLRARVFMAVILGLAAAAMAHHGNPDAPAPAPWSNGPSIPGPAKPQGPGF